MLTNSHTFSVKRVALGLTIAVCSLAIGGIVGARLFSDEMSEKRKLQAQTIEQQTRLLELEQELVQLRAAREIDQRSLERVHKSLTALQARLSSSDEELWLYRHLLQDKAGTTPDAFSSSIKMTKGETPDEVLFKLLLYRKKSKKSQEVTVNYLLTIKGSDQSFPIFGENEETGARQASFKYFHVEEGKFKLPKGFQPEAVEIHIWKDKDAKVSQVFPWQL